ncbi:hypothetical protein [uncultured Bacteroides sp.]|uniref:hypothetical protein n=1 Tax=uncultured Bacteroides sp. TaxID=162156 RepID=UPI00259958C1|nr:hypothetical protein [uncultured Bacteroides sp.]
MAFDYDYTGNPTLLDRLKVAFFASRVVSPTVEEQALRWAEACCATDRVVISGFQSPLEKSVFELLLKARHSVIWALGRALYRRYPPDVEVALAEQRILIFAVRNARRTGWQTALTRNYTIATMAEESVYALRTDGCPSSLDVLYGLELGRKPVRCFPQ